jgi:nitric oxide reductase NorQ protein
MQARALESEAYFIQAEPYYEATGDEIKIFEAAYRNKLPILLKGPTGCGKRASWNTWLGGCNAR